MTRFSLLLAAILFVPAASHSRTWIIVPDGSGDAPTVQAGIDSAANGDTVSLADGTFSGAGNRNIDYGGKAIIVGSASGDPSACILDCRSGSPIANIHGFRFHTGEGAGSVLEGVSVKRAYLSSTVGAAVLCENGSSPTISHCRFYDNVSDIHGSGIACVSSAPTISDCEISGGTGSFDGGGLYCTDASPTLIRCTLSGNEVSREGGGGAFYGDGAPWIEDCVFEGNSAEHGGGLYCLTTNLTVVRCVFRENHANDVGGGAIVKNVGQPSFSECRFEANSAEKGGGIACWEGGSSPVIERCVFLENTGFDGGAILCKTSDADISSCTMWGNKSSYGGGLHVRDNAHPVVENTIIARSIQGPAVYCRDATAGASLACCDLYGNAGGDWVGCIVDQAGVSGNFAANPLFCFPWTGNVALRVGSPCLEAPGCGGIGAEGLGCDALTGVPEGSREVMSWSALKKKFR